MAKKTKTQDVNIRDPYILKHEGSYYLYGTRSETTWGPAEGFDCYVSKDLENWSEAIEIFHKDGSFWADRNYWAPEAYFYNGYFYLVTTFGSEEKGMGVQILRSESPTGPFEAYSKGLVTPEGWQCLDGTLYFDSENTPFLIYSRSFLQEPKAGMYSIKLKEDLSGADGEPLLMFYASDAPWSKPFPYAKQEFGMDGDVYFSDGPFLHRDKDGNLMMIWSSWGENGYTVGLAHSDNKELNGKWTHQEEPLFNQDGGHGMIFRTNEDKLMITLHYPNDKLCEHPVFYELSEVDGSLKIK